MEEGDGERGNGEESRLVIMGRGARKNKRTISTEFKTDEHHILS
jgi:hypothetical protein